VFFNFFVWNFQLTVTNQLGVLVNRLANLPYSHIARMDRFTCSCCICFVADGTGTQNASSQTDQVTILPSSNGMPAAASSKPQGNTDERSVERGRSRDRRRRRQKDRSHDVCTWEVHSRPSSSGSVSALRISRRCGRHCDHVSMSVSSHQSLARPRQNATQCKSSQSHSRLVETMSEARRGSVSYRRERGYHRRAREVSRENRSKPRQLDEISRQKTRMSGRRSGVTTGTSSRYKGSRQMSANERSFQHAHVGAVHHSASYRPREPASRKRPQQYSASNGVDSMVKRQRVARSMVNRQSRYSRSVAVRSSFVRPPPVWLHLFLFPYPLFGHVVPTPFGCHCFFPVHPTFANIYW